jgi:hypothetical protein
MLNDILKEPTDKAIRERQKDWTTGKLRKLLNTNNLEELKEEEIIYKDKIQVIGLTLSKLIKYHDLRYISLIIKKAMEHLSTSEFYTAAVNDHHGGDDSLIIEILGEIKDAFLACDILVCDDLDNAKNKALGYILGEV